MKSPSITLAAAIFSALLATTAPATPQTPTSAAATETSITPMTPEQWENHTTVIFKQTGVTPEEHHAVLRMKMLAHAREKIPEALQRLNLPPIKTSINDYLLKLPMQEQKRIQTTACILLLENWQKNGIPK